MRFFNLVVVIGHEKPDYRIGGIVFMVIGSLLLLYGVKLQKNRPKSDEYLDYDRGTWRAFLCGLFSLIGGIVLYVNN